MSRPGFSIGATKVGSKLSLHDEGRYRDLIRRLKDGEYDVTIERHVPKRTDAQNKYLHAGPLPILMEAIGYNSMEELKRDLMGECWGWTPSPLTGQPVPVRAHTSDMDVEQFSFFIDWLVPFAMQKCGVELPLPDESLKQNTKDEAA